jgi:hypothetical protein
MNIPTSKWPQIPNQPRRVGKYIEGGLFVPLPINLY